ncbi:MAG: ATP-binding cassette domain-containing protein, partial [Paracoccaceae bacterium]
MGDKVIVLDSVWKIFGADANTAMAAVQDRGLNQSDVLSEFDCVVGIADCSFSVNRGEIFCVMGLSGSGKSTLVRHLNRLIEPTAGRISILGQDVLALDRIELRQIRS